MFGTLLGLAASSGECGVAFPSHSVGSHSSTAEFSAGSVSSCAEASTYSARGLTFCGWLAVAVSAARRTGVLVINLNKIKTPALQKGMEFYILGESPRPCSPVAGWK